MAKIKQIFALVVIAATLCCSILIQPSAGWYLPGTAYIDYDVGSPVEVKVQKLSSNKVALPYEYYSLPFCRPTKIKNTPENLGEILFGDRIENSLYEVQMKKDVKCQVIPQQYCPKYDEENIKKFTDKVNQAYQVQLIIDNLPISSIQRTQSDYCGSFTVSSDDPNNPKYYSIGYPLGCIKEKNGVNVPIINNHLTFVLRYHEIETTNDKGQTVTKYRVVGAGVVPSSFKHEVVGEEVTTCKPDKSPSEFDQQFQYLEPNENIIWSYSVRWEQSDIRWASRWDAYLSNADSQDTQVHWFSIINSLMIVLFLTGMVAMIMLRTLNKDFAIYNQLETSDDAQEETGWKLVHGEVFRTPSLYNLFSAYVGTGAQVNAMSIITLVFALLGFLSPANRGGLMTVMLLLFVFSGSFAGYYSARFYKFFKGTHWKRNTIITAFMFPGVIFGIFFALNFLIWVFGHHSSGAVPFLTLLSLMAMWFGISVPLVFAGSYFGRKKDEFTVPVKTNLIPRRVPDQPWYMRPPFSILMGGILPFGAVFIELFFILSSIWLHRYYYVFGFLFIVFLILVLTCAEITIVMIYFQLCSGDYHWWWRSYLTSGSSGLYLFLYSIFYYFTRLNTNHVLSGILFFGYMALVSYFFFVLTGSIGFAACFWFVRKIYGAIKVD